MRFTLKALLPPLAVWVAYSLYVAAHPNTPHWALWYTLIMVWLTFAFVGVAVYWIGRLISRAGRDSANRR